MSFACDAMIGDSHNNPFFPTTMHYKVSSAPSTNNPMNRTERHNTKLPSSLTGSVRWLITRTTDKYIAHVGLNGMVWSLEGYQIPNTYVQLTK